LALIQELMVDTHAPGISIADGQLAPPVILQTSSDAVGEGLPGVTNPWTVL
jgi:hypothetical protein